MHYKRQLFYFLVFFVLGTSTKAQVFELGLGGGGAGYMGDLNQKDPLKISGISAGAYVKMNIDPYWAVGLHYTYGKIKGDDLNSDNGHFKANRGVNFNTPLNEVSLQVDFNFLEYFAGGGRKNFTPYIFTGIGGVLFNPKGKYDIDANGEKETYDLRFYRTEGEEEPYRNYNLTIPYGAGIKVRLKENWGLFSQIGYRTAYTDYLDDVSGNYPDPSSWTGSPRQTESIFLSAPKGNLNSVKYSQRGDSRKRDTYMFVGIGISYTFVSQKCYTF